MSGWCVVTGASGGIGAALAREAARDGYDLILSARDVARLEPLAQDLRATGREVVCIAADLARADGAEALWQAARDGREIAVLVNNAGLGVHGRIQDSATWPRERDTVAVNVTAAADLMKLAAVDMAARGAGRILNVASSAAFMPGPGMGRYHASKAFLLYLSEAAWQDLQGTGVSVTALCPGPVDTGFFDAGDMKGALALRMLPTAPADKVARAGWRGAMRGRRMVVPGLLYKIIGFSTRLTPRGMLVRGTQAYWSKRR